MSVTVTLYAWWAWAYLLAGLLLYLPLSLLAWSDGSASSRRPFSEFLTHGSFGWSDRKRLWYTLRSFVVMVVLWPFALWEARSMRPTHFGGGEG